MAHIETTPTQHLSARVKELRRQRGWSADKLAEAMRGVGIGWQRPVVANLESGRRGGVSVEELLALAYVLDVAPTHLLVPLDNDAPYTPVAGVTLSSGEVREWVRGRRALKGRRHYFSEVPDSEWAPPPQDQMMRLLQGDAVNVSTDASGVTEITPQED